MSRVTTFFRHCPACGRRFEVRLVGKNLVSNERDTYPTRSPPTTSEGSSTWAHMAARTGLGGNVTRASQVVWDVHSEPGKEVEVTVGRKGFEYAYKCKHCGHQWTEKRSEESPPHIER